MTPTTTTARPTDHTLMRLGIFLAVVLAAMATFDLLRGRGGRAWLVGSAGVAAIAEVDSSAVTATLFRGVRLFDGENVVATTDVLVRDGLVAAVGGDVAAPPAAEVIEGEGMTLMPGMIDAHAHVFGPVLRTALMLGVTTELDMFTEPNGAAVLRREQANGEALDRADLFSAGILATAPGGHGTEYGMEIPTLTTPEEADEFVQARVDEGSDYLKIIRTDASSDRFSTLDFPTIGALIEAAHARDLLAVVHVGTVADARAVVELGADGIVHVFYDQPATADVVELMQRHSAFVTPTLSVLESASGVAGGSELAADPRLAPYLSASDRAGLETGFPAGVFNTSALANGLESVAALHQAGVRVLAGTDAPNPGTGHGASMHRELGLLVQAGLSPVEALVAATSAPADAFGLDDRGRVRAGLRADLLLVRGDPTTDVTATRDIVGVWKFGVRADRDGYRDGVAATSASAARPDVGSGLVAGFNAGELDSAFGSGWMVSTDSMVGGGSTAETMVVDGGAAGTSGSLRVNGNIAASGPSAWAGPMWFPGPQQFQPADLSEYEGIEFWARGDGATHMVMLFAQNLGQIPTMTSFVPGEEWQRLRLPFSDFAGLDPAGLQGVLFTGAGEGAFEFEVDEITFW